MARMIIAGEWRDASDGGTTEIRNPAIWGATQGGFVSNFECWLYTNKAKEVDSLTEWFDSHFRDAHPITKDAILKYEPRFKKTKKAMAAAHKQQMQMQEGLTKMQQASMTKRKEAIRLAKRYFTSKDFLRSRQNALKGVKAIRKTLDYPNFDFDLRSWKDLYKIKTLGHLIPIYCARIFKREKRLKAALSNVTNTSIAEHQRLAAVLDKEGKQRIPYLRLNAISKILACSDKTKWPVYNSRVDKVLRRFGYHVPRMSSTAGKYLAFTSAMHDFMKDCGIEDVVALDCFFNAVSRQKDEPTK